jgi:hypothetical protein
MLKTLDLLESGHGVQQLHAHGAKDRPPVQEEEVAARPGGDLIYQFQP